MPYPCYAHSFPAMPLRVWNVSFPFDLHSAAMYDSHLPCHAHAMLWPCRSYQGHGTARPLRDGLWANWLRSASSSYHAVFHEGCYQKHTNPPHNDPYLWLLRVVVAHYEKDDLLNCWTSSLDISGYHADFHYGHGTVRAWQGHGMAWQGDSMGAAWLRHAMCESDFNRQSWNMECNECTLYQKYSVTHRNNEF